MVLTAGVGAILFFLLNLRDLGQLAWMIGGLLLYHRAVTDGLFRRDINPLQQTVQDGVQADEAIAEYLNLSTSASETVRLRSAIESYYRIGEPEFRWHKLRSLNEFIRALDTMVLHKHSPTMLTSEYYAWLLPRIEAALPGNRIWAVSRFMDCEWDDSPEEQQFLQANLAAASRGVDVCRLFITTKESWNAAVAASRPIRSQVEHPQLASFFGDIEAIRKRDAGILSLIGDGLIGFDDDVVLQDEHSDDGHARGFISIKQSEVEDLSRAFNSLKNLCTRVSLEERPKGQSSGDLVGEQGADGRSAATCPDTPPPPVGQH
ncbi:MAG TPA: hypothetical protein DEG88_06340 [Propionibacteriaceae bacterium]|nr:hypothetical protein [Propionibacteriaceae bacterium]HBY22903.1 hypothetical protein [Propionibacteriaceae bacterium]